jgi:hypothetical protein
MPKTEIEILLVENAERWSALVLDAPAPDVYYLPAYAQAASEIEHAEPVAIIAGQDSCKFLAPLLLRSGSAIVSGSTMNWTDASTPYGYGGLLPLSSSAPDAHSIHCFLEDLRNWCSHRDAVCCVLRLHPLMDQAEWFLPQEQWREQLKIYLRGSTSAVDLEHWDDARDCPEGMRKGRRSDLNLARRTLRVTWTNAESLDVASNLDRFVALYEQAMEGRRADDFYKFSPAYFSRLASLGHHLNIAFAWMDDQLAGASIFLTGRDYAHYHLAAGNEIGMKHKAATLLIVEGAKWARQQRCKLLHLGGGVSPGDSLEDFKRSFGTRLYRYSYLVMVIDQERFEQISQLPNAPWPYSLNQT